MSIKKNNLPQRIEEQNLIVPRKLEEWSKHYIENSLASSTRKLYTTDLKIFAEWCESIGHAPLPALPTTVVMFLTYQANEGIQPATLTRRLAAIKMIHEAHDHEPPTQHKLVRATLKGIKREKGIAPKKKAPATAERIADMIVHCPDNLIGYRDKALLLIGFAGAFRRSELVGLTTEDIERTAEGIKVTIRRSKTDQEGQGQVIAILNGTRFRVVDTLMAWLDAANINSGHLFRPIKKGGQVQSMGLTDRSVANIVKQYASKAGLTVDDFSGHSLRSGFITSGAAAGADLFKLMEVSRHKKPETVMGYVRESKLFENHAGEKFL